MDWFFRTLFEIPCIKERIQIIICDDDDQCFLLASTEILQEMSVERNITILHIFCTTHRLKNIKQKMRELGFSPELLEMGMSFLYVLWYSSSVRGAEEALSTLESLSEELALSIDKYVIPDVHHFCGSYLSDVYLLGFQNRFPAKSMNHLLKNWLSDLGMNISDL
jgi:hypothetical protein